MVKTKKKVYHLVKEDKDYQTINLRDEINKKINSFDTTRSHRIELSKRFEKYSSKWKMIFFILNFEAVIFITLALKGVSPYGLSENMFTLISSVFSIYVILLQYYINELNYRERALKMHYHQLEIEDQILKLKEILLKLNHLSEDYIEEEYVKYQYIMLSYQNALKSNENHISLDKKKAESRDKPQITVRDYTVDNIVYYFNMITSIGILILLCGAGIWSILN